MLDNEIMDKPSKSRTHNRLLAEMHCTTFKDFEY